MNFSLLYIQNYFYFDVGFSSSDPLM